MDSDLLDCARSDIAPCRSPRIDTDNAPSFVSERKGGRTMGQLDPSSCIRGVYVDQGGEVGCRLFLIKRYRIDPTGGR